MCVAVCRSVLQCGVVRCNVLQRVAVCCSVVQCVLYRARVAEADHTQNAFFYHAHAQSRLLALLAAPRLHSKALSQNLTMQPVRLCVWAGGVGP